jgi:predicted amidohydrolase YtcJ
MAAGLDLRFVYEKQQALELMRASQAETLLVQGWNNSLYSFGPEELDNLPPVFICNTSLHSFLMNESTRQQLAKTHPQVLRNLENQDWVERNLPALFKLIVGIQGCGTRTLKEFYGQLSRQGVWDAEEMLLPNAGVLEAFRKLGFLKRTRVWADPETYSLLDPEARRLIHGIKLFTDGALGAKTAAMKKPLASGERGLLLRTDRELQSLLLELSTWGKPIAIHALGDRALDQVIDSVEVVGRRSPSFPSVRIEHCQFITLEDARRVRSLGMTLSMQPNFSPESMTYRDRLPREYCDRNNCFRMLIDEAGFVPGEDLVFGSDGMPHGVEFALQSSLFPPLPTQELTVEEFTAGYCMPDISTGHIDFGIDRENRSILIEEINVSGSPLE